ncbi:hypothetical protein CQ018_17430 [Arthrobacter sp. MYb227]|uniref:glycosyltransferase family 4 protein n=1 Tax=Arthrobacter sp. MYb227 TaxID=1848601 RepID=UPI000CFC96A2|nr:glycosyltransferase family 4 protein [Arthrobacter sp. MYb227]PQZ87727.1 hypothetical protein CQ018_17430 [Arthrobacter sp. MYb227]
MFNSKSELTLNYKVLHLDHTTALGGAELALARLCKMSNGWEPTIALPGKNDQDLGPFESLEPIVVRVGEPQLSGASRSGINSIVGFIIRILEQVWHLRREHSFKNADIIHTNTSRSGLYGALSVLLSRKRLVVHLRDMVTRESLGTMGSLLFKSIVLPRANGVIANSEATLATATKYIRSSASIAVIPSPAGIRSDPKPTTIRDSVDKIGMVARIDPWKGQELLIEAFARSFGGSATRLVLAGAPAFGHEEYLSAITQKAEVLGIASQIDFLGHVNDVNSIIDDLDICVQASIRPEPLGQNVLQYLAAGKPVISADQGGPTEWIIHGENGLLFKAGDVESLASNLKAMRSKSVREKLASGTTRVKPVPTDEMVARMHADLFSEVIKK